MYKTIADFGQNTCGYEPRDPLTMCLADTMDKSFMNGGIARLFGPKSRKCEAFMADRCAKNYDGYCEYYYQNKDTGTPLSQPYPNSLQDRPWMNRFGLTNPVLTGDQFLQNVAERKYCRYANCVPTYEPFNPLDVHSPMVTYYVDPVNSNNVCIPICDKINPATLDNDPVMNRMLANPDAASSTLINICNTANRTGIDLKGTKLGTVCDLYLKNIAKINNV